MKKIILLITILSFAFFVNAQTIARQVFSGAGSSVSNSSYIVSSTIGEAITGKYSSAGNFTFTQGFQQGISILNPIKEIVDIYFYLYPNPVSDILKLDINVSSSRFLYLKIIDLSGQILYQTNMKLETGIFYFRRDIKDYCPGIYFLTLNDANNRTVKSIKFMKK